MVGNMLDTNYNLSILEINTLNKILLYIIIETAK